MIRRQHIVENFFDDAEPMRESLDVCFRDVYTRRINWHYFCDPLKYTYLRAQPQEVFPEPVFERFLQRLRGWCIDKLGLIPVDIPYLHLMVDGCKLGLHSDFQNGVWGYVYSLTRWEGRKFSGGETMLLRDGIPSYKKHHVQGDALYELIAARFNQLLVFDDRIVHATPVIEGTMDPLDGRIALVGHIRATTPRVVGSLPGVEVRRVLAQALSHLADRIGVYKDVQGTISFKLRIAPSGAVEAVEVLTDNVITPLTGYGHSDAASAVKVIIQQSMARLRFPSTASSSTVVVPVLVPLPDLRQIIVSVPHRSSRDAIREWASSHLEGLDGLELRGRWEGYTYTFEEPIAGSIEIDSERTIVSFESPMWVPLQRDRFQKAFTEWAHMASEVGHGVRS